VNAPLPTLAELDAAGIDAIALLRAAREVASEADDAAGVAEIERLHRELCGELGVDYIVDAE